jgi:hypothetical protein
MAPTICLRQAATSESNELVPLRADASGPRGRLGWPSARGTHACAYGAVCSAEKYVSWFFRSRSREKRRENKHLREAWGTRKSTRSAACCQVRTIARRSRSRPASKQRWLWITVARRIRLASPWATALPRTLAPEHRGRELGGRLIPVEAMCPIPGRGAVGSTAEYLDSSSAARRGRDACEAAGA